MSLNSETITQIQAMLQADPALLAQLQAQTELAGAAAVITKAATARGLDINEADLMSHLAAEQSQASATTMSDAELEQVAGGGVGAGIGMSIFTLGLFCAMTSITSALTNQRCGDVLASVGEDSVRDSSRSGRGGRGNRN